MKPISLHVPDEAYSDLKALAARRGQPVAELIREAMTEYLARESGRGVSLFDLAPHPSGPLLEPWSRSELLDEMRGR
jgi:ribbon-helix-helix CopG family protein